MVKVTRRLLEDYRKNKRSIPLLEEELEEMRCGEKGLGSSVILDYSTGYPVPQGIVGFNGSYMTSGTKRWTGRRPSARPWRTGSAPLRTGRPGASSGCFTWRG